MQLSDGPSDKFLVTCGNDRALRIWSNEHSDAYKLDREIQLGRDIVPNVCAACVVSGAMCILSASLTGHIIIWEPSNPLSPSNPFIKKFSKFAASCCLWMPPISNDRGLLAVVGFNSGDICGYTYDRSVPMNKNSCSQIFKISAHNFEVCSIVPVSGLAEECQCFASAGRDAEIRFWSLENTQCKYSYRFKVYQKDNNNALDSISGHGKAWIPLASTGIESPCFLAFDTNGNLYTFNAIDKPLSCESTVSSLRHAGLVFSFISIPGSPHLFLSFGKDSQVIAWKKTCNDWQTLTPVASIPCVPGKISCLSQAPGLYSPLAVGLSDGSLLILRNATPPEPNSFISVSRLSPLPPSAAATGISAIAWHPDPLSENLIAIGSSKGHVDVIDVLKNQKRSRNFNHLAGCIYRVAWGPKLFASSEEEGTADMEDKLLVYAVANGSIYLLISFKKPPLNITLKFASLLSNSDDHKLAEITFKRIPEEGITSYSWLVGLGSMNGGVNIFGLSRIFGSLVPLSRVDIHKKCIISMVWSYHTDKYWLAVSSAESFITIIDSTEQAVNPPPENIQPHQFTSCMATLQGHGARVSALDWSPTDPDLLLSGSYDCTATVWRVGLGSSTAIANYRDHLSRIHACAWSPDISDFVFSGENFGYLVGWRPSAQGVIAPPLSRKNRNPSAKIPSCANSEQVKVPESEIEKDEKSEITLIDTPSLPQSFPIKRTEPHANRKPSLLPSLFATPSVIDISFPVLTLSPPIRMQNRFEIITDFIAYMREPLCFDNSKILPEFDLLYGGCAQRRRELVRFTESEALKHLEAASGPNKPARLDAYFSLLLWLGRGQVVAKKAVEFQYTPFWLMWALELILKGSASRPIFSSLVESREDSKQQVAQDDFFQHKILQLTASNEYTWASTLLVCAGRTGEAIRLLLLCGRAKEALLLFRLRLNAEANPELLSKCLSLLSEKQAHTGLPNSALAFLAAGEIDKAISAVRGNSEANLPALDRMVALWTSLAIIPSSPVIPVRLVQACIAYAANLSIEDERRQFIDQWRVALSSKGNAEYLLNCASFILLSEWQEGALNLSLLDEGIDELARIVFDRQPSFEEAECLAGVVLDFGIATLDEKYTPNFKRSLDILKHNHPDAFFILTKRLSFRKCEPTIPGSFMNENKTVVIKEHHKTLSGHTLKPVFVYSREEYFNASPSQKSHQVSTLSVPQESPNIVSMPKQLPSYVMAGEHSVPNAQLVRRRIDYQEVAEYRMLKPTAGSTTTKTSTTTANKISATTLANPVFCKPLSVRIDESPVKIVDEKASLSSSTSSAARRKSRPIPPTDRVLRSGKTAGIFRESIDYEAATPLPSATRQNAIRRRAKEIEEDIGEESTIHLSATESLMKQSSNSRLSEGSLGMNNSASRPWHLSNMLGLSAEPSYRSPSFHVRESRDYYRRVPSGSIFSSLSFPSEASHFASLCGRIGSCILNLIAIPLVLLHYLYLAVCTFSKAIYTSTSRLFHNASRSKNLFSYQPGSSYSVSNTTFTSNLHDHRSSGDVVSPLFIRRCPSSCCLPLVLLMLLLLLSSALVGFIYRPVSSNTTSSLSEQAYLFGLLPSDAECYRLTRSYPGRSTVIPADIVADSELRDLRWRCLSLVYLRPSVNAIHQHLSDLWTCIAGWFQPFFTSSSHIPPATEETHFPEPTPQNIDDLLKRLKKIDSGMADLKRQIGELKEAHSSRLSTHEDGYGVLTSDVSQLHSVVTSLKEQISALADKVSDKTDYESKQLLIEELSKQAAFVSTASLDVRLQELRSHLEAIAKSASPTAGTSADESTLRKETAQIERFDKAISELSTIVNTQKAILEEKLTNLKEELDSFKKNHSTSLMDIGSKVSEEVTSVMKESQSNLNGLESRLSTEMGKISSRIDSLERLNGDLEQALTKLISELASIQKTGVSSESSVSKSQIEEIFNEMKSSFYKKLTVDLKQKIVEELSHSLESGAALELKLLSLIRTTVDESLKNTFIDKTQTAQMESIPINVLAYIDGLLETFTADGTGKADFALESAGGTVVSTRCTRTYTSFKSAISLFGITLAYWSRSPNEILQPSNHPGECWCFYGQEGQAIVRLAASIHVTGVSLEHIPKALAHTGRIDSAPRDFVIKALDSESDAPHQGDILGEFTYDESGEPIQYFSVKDRANAKPTRFVELSVKSNHGHPEYTCIYRLRVHGRMAEEDGK
ncbi:hypothetical protein ACTXT7_005960 [Hymenolepis weldensis]